MQRCFELARLGAGHVAPNPMVGAVLVHDGKIIGEGWHRQYGEAHAEVNAIGQALQNGYAAKISQSTLYVSLEPCAHFGKTPPCADLVIQHKIPTVVIACRDPFEQVNGKGIEKLKAAGVQVETGILEKEAVELNKRFFTFHEQQRPYIILKWATTADGFIAPHPPAGGIQNSHSKRLLISNEYSNRLVHKWRSEEAGILVGTNTALLDDPSLTVRSWKGPSPVRLVLDLNLRLPGSLKIFNKEVRTVVFNTLKQEEEGNLLYYRLKKEGSLVPQLLEALHELKIQSVLVEGGTQLLQSFIDAGSWDEARVIRNNRLSTGEGLAEPQLTNALLKEETTIASDTLRIFYHQKNEL
jgi:diaminohydroxyphosphoribosylaminopyrimidine deaminase/5-amino-6-(5-phosphoribosylamino)uracil reductase